MSRHRESEEFDKERVQDNATRKVMEGGHVQTRSEIIQEVVPDVEVIGFTGKNYLDELAFMEEVVFVTVQETTDKNAENPVQVGCNGQVEQFWRGLKTQTKRKFLNSLIVKQLGVETPEVVKDDGMKEAMVRTKNALKYQFVVHGDTPRGDAWLEQAIAAA